MMKNKSILFITDSCPPNLTMSGVVMKNIIDLVIEENEIDIIAIRQSDNDVETYHGIKIRYVKSFPYFILNMREKRRRADGKPAKLTYGIGTLAFRTGSVLTRLASPTGTNRSLTRGIYRQVRKALGGKDYDYVLCNAKPFEGFDAVLPFIGKRKSTKFIAYQTDDFVTAGDERFIAGFIIKRRTRKRRERLNEFIDAFHHYCILESVYQKEAGYIKNKSRIKSVGLPLLIERKGGAADKKKRIREADDTIRLVYAGSLVRSFRPPDDCLDMMLEVAKQRVIRISLYQRGDCGDVIDRYVRRSNGSIANHGCVSTEEAYRAMEDSDILISISNYAGDQVSGKTFEYMSMEKPIIHFYYHDKDRNADVLRGYGLALCIKASEGRKGKNVEMIRQFIDSSKNKVVERKDFMENYKEYTPAMVVQRLFRF